MTTLYYADNYGFRGRAWIEEIEVVRLTDKSIWKDGDHRRGKPVRRARFGGLFGHFDTPDEARAFVYDAMQDEAEKIRDQIVLKQKRIDRLEAGIDVINTNSAKTLIGVEKE